MPPNVRRTSSAPGLMRTPPRAFAKYELPRYSVTRSGVKDRPEDCWKVGDELCGCAKCDEERALRQRYHRICDDLLQRRKAKRKQEMNRIRERRRAENAIVPETPLDSIICSTDSEDVIPPTDFENAENAEEKREFQVFWDECNPPIPVEIIEEGRNCNTVADDITFTCGTCGIAFSMKSEVKKCLCA